MRTACGQVAAWGLDGVRGTSRGAQSLADRTAPTTGQAYFGRALSALRPELVLVPSNDRGTERRGGRVPPPPCLGVECRLECNFCVR